MFLMSEDAAIKMDIVRNTKIFGTKINYNRGVE